MGPYKNSKKVDFLKDLQTIKRNYHIKKILNLIGIGFSLATIALVIITTFVINNDFLFYLTISILILDVITFTIAAFLGTSTKWVFLPRVVKKYVVNPNAVEIKESALNEQVKVEGTENPEFQISNNMQQKGLERRYVQSKRDKQKKVLSNIQAILNDESKKEKINFYSESFKTLKRHEWEIIKTDHDFNNRSDLLVELKRKINTDLAKIDEFNFKPLMLVPTLGIGIWLKEYRQLLFSLETELVISSRIKIPWFIWPLYILLFLLSLVFGLIGLADTTLTKRIIIRRIQKELQ